MPLFGSPKFFGECKNAINKNEEYADSTHDWETSFLFVVELDEETKEAFKNLTKMAEDNEEVKRIIKNMGEGYGFDEEDLKKGKIDELAVYLDLWHGKCREIKTIKDIDAVDSDNRLRGSYYTWERIAREEIDPMKALMQKKLKLEGSLIQLMKYIRGAKELVKSIKSVDIQFPSDYI